VIIVALVLLTLAATLFGYRLVRGPSIVDRIIAVDGLVIVAVGGIAADAVRLEDARFADAAILLAIIAFVGTGITARFVERRGG
jgi:multicomponent Na+:H+ antiporter subunit F